jgi:hypothetical protein
VKHLGVWAAGKSRSARGSAAPRHGGHWELHSGELAGQTGQQVDRKAVVGDRGGNSVLTRPFGAWEKGACRAALMVARDGVLDSRARGVGGAAFYRRPVLAKAVRSQPDGMVAAWLGVRRHREWLGGKGRRGWPMTSGGRREAVCSAHGRAARGDGALGTWTSVQGLGNRRS